MTSTRAADILREIMKSRFFTAVLLLAITIIGAVVSNPVPARAAEGYVPFDGGKSAWHGGFDRYDFVMDEETLAISPFKAPEGEKFGVRDLEKGQRRCLVIVPKAAAPGQPWSWQGCYWDHQPQTEVELLRRGFHIAYISANATLKPGREWDAWYAFLTEKHGLSRKPVFIGMSRGGEYAYTWAAANPDKVSFTKSSFYSIENFYKDFPKEGTYITCRGAWFAECYERYSFELGGVEGPITVIAPKTPAPGKPWVFRAEFVPRDAVVDLKLLARGFHIVTGPVPFNADGPVLSHWNAVYKHLTDHGFSRKPVTEGAGRAAGEAYAWAIENPEKVSCIYVENPVLRSFMSKTPPLDNLAPLAKAGVPLLHVSGSLDPALNDHTRVVEKRYKELGGPITVIIKEGEGHYPLAPKDPKPVVDFIVGKGSAETVRRAMQYLKVDYPASTASNELQIAVTYTLWIPDGVKTVRGIIVHQHGAGTTASIEGSTAAYDLHWQALAKKWDCALLGPSYHVLNEKTDTTPGGSELWFDPRRGSEKTFLKALGEFAAMSGHPEIESVPWALWGHSGGGIWADVMTTLHPGRVTAVWMRSGSALMFLTHPEFAAPNIPAALYAIPMMTNPGVKEKPAVKGQPDEPDKRSEAEKMKMKGPWLGNLATFREYRAHGGLIGFAPDPRTGHECGDSRYLAIPFFDACLRMRLPDKGSKDQTLKPMDTTRAWLAQVLSDEAKPAAEFKGNPNEAVWLPNEAVARAWMEYVRTGATSDTTPPPAPFDVKVSVMGDQGTEIVWSAEADFESGIGGFIVTRDGQELAKVPEKPAGKFGRPLFQSMTYHDTPGQPMPQMRYVDAPARSGENHTYNIITVNSVGLKSEQSAASP